MTISHAHTVSGPPLLKLRNISKSFSGVEVLSGVDFELRAGEVHALAGENGAGKSTLMKIVAGVYNDYTGTMELEGKLVRFASPREATDRGIAIIHQEMSLIGPMSVLDNIFLGRESRFGRIWRRERKERAGAATLFPELGLEVDASRPVEEYPPAIQQMTEIVKALSMKSSVIIMDEPTSSLNDPEVERLFAVISLLKRRGVGVVYITHRMEEIFRVADRITVLRDGKSVGSAPAGELSRPELIRWMVGREVNQQFPARTGPRGDAVLRVEGVRIHDARSRVVVDHVTFEARRGEILGIAGLQGSGNSELLNGLFGGYGRLPSGTVRFEGKRLDIPSPRQAVACGMALLTNDRKKSGLVMEMGIPQNITLAALRSYTPRGWLDVRREREAAERHATALRLRVESIDQDVATLSGGNQQKVVLAKWLETRPRLFLLDDPTRGVDVGVKHEIYDLMNRWTGDGCTILLVTSDMLELLALADRIIVMCRGKVAASFLRGEATQEKVMHAAMGAEVPH